MAKAKAKSTTVTVGTVGVDAEDPIISVVQHVLNLEEGVARVEMSATSSAVDSSYFAIGTLLNRVMDEGWYVTWGYTSFTDYVAAELAYKPRKAWYLMGIAKSIIASGVTWPEVSELGWSKLKELAPVLTKENVATWVEIGLACNIGKLQEEVRKALAGDVDLPDHGPETSNTTTISFKVHVDQKESITQAIEKAKGEAGTEFDGVALESICLAYLAGGKPKAVGLKANMKKSGYMEVLETFEALWPEIDLTIDKMPDQPNSGSVQVTDEL